MQPSTSLSSKSFVLVVDDNIDVLDATTTLLDVMGFATLSADSPLQALDLARSHPLQALVTDFSMPEMNGAVLVDRVAELQPSIRAVITSGMDPAHVHHLLRHPAVVLAKPYDLDDFIEALRN